MSLNETVSADRLHIGFFGKRNAGKSGLVNAVTGQALSLTSDVPGTTTDPVQKAMELLPIGPVVILDTPGLDDEGTLGEMRVKRAKRMLDKTDLAVVVIDASRGVCPEDEALVRELTERKKPFLLAFNKCELLASRPALPENALYVSAVTGENIYELKERLAALAGAEKNERRIVGDLLLPGDRVVLVTPIDSAAPKGRLILPQQQTLRDILDAGAIAAVCRETELEKTLAAFSEPPKMVITDSQAFELVNKIVPKEIPLTSFSILFARYKGNLEGAAKSVKKLSQLCDGDTVLISEGCTHHRQCDDIGTVKLPAWLRAYTGKKLDFAFTSGGEFPEDLSPYAVVIHCGACMLGEAELKSRAAKCRAAGVPMTNYGMAIAEMNGIFKRSCALFPQLEKV
mgnify:FL=1